MVLTTLSLVVAVVATIGTYLALGHDIMRALPPSVEHRIIVSAVPLDKDVRSFPGVGDGFRVGFDLRNSSTPQTELRNVFGQVWTHDDYLIAVFRERGVSFDEQRANGRLRVNFNFPVLAKTAFVRFPTLYFRLPEPGREIIFGAQITSTEIDKQQYYWKIVNDAGRPRFIIVDSPHDLK